MEFLTCSCPLPSSNGLHVVSSSCGSGKSTIISQIAAKKKDSGVLVVEQTIDSAKEVEQKIKNELGMSAAFIPGTILNLNCQDSEVMAKYRDHPEDLARVKILIITAARMMIDPIDLFLRFGLGLRKYVLVDEMINFYPESYSISKGLQDTLTYISKSKTSNGRVAVKTIDISGVKYYRHIYKDTGLMKAAYWNGKKPKHRLDELKMEYIFNHVNSYGFSPKLQRIQDFCGRTCVILFDGTADCIFSPTDSRLVPLSGFKYSSDITFTQFHSSLKRKNNEGWAEGDVKKSTGEFLNLVKDLTLTGHKVLVVCWKTLDVFRPKNKNNDADGIELGEVGKKSYSFPELLKNVLVSEGAVSDKFQVIYRGSGQDRGSNQYRDYDSVVFLGEWRIPDDITRDINNQFGCKCEFQDYLKSLLIQTICRLRIRQHKGDSISVHLSSDISYNLMWSVQEYFRSNSNPKCNISGLKKPCEKRPKAEKGWIFDLISLYGYDGKIRNAIDTDSNYSLNITLDELYSYVPVDKKCKDRYRRFIDYLKTRKIYLTIS